MIWPQQIFIFALSSFFLACCLLIVSCAPQQKIPSQIPLTSAETTWNRFWAVHNSSNNNISGGYKIKSSLFLSSPKGGHRLYLTIWGNFNLPMRIDIQAGIFKNTFSLWKITKNRWLAYYPKENKAYIHHDSRSGLSQLGFTIPFTLQDLSYILTAHWPEILPQKYQEAKYVPDQGWKYFFSQGRSIDSLTLNDRGRIIAICGQNPYFWSLSLSEYQNIEQEKPVSMKYVLQKGNNYRAILNVQEIHVDKTAWPDSNLKLKLPKDTIFIPLFNHNNTGGIS